VGPILLKVYNSYVKFKKALTPVIDYKNKFNEAFDNVKHAYDIKLRTYNSEIAKKEKEITEKKVELFEVDTQIEHYEFELNHSITKRAFNNFINKKTKDENYEKHLGVISIIRKDFETLSALFEEITIPTKINEEERKKLEERKKVSDEFRGYFIKPLDRIILYIDDLDRCSDEKVLEVIQAVHLLMAFPLFNVVVGVDKRCVNNALIYKNLVQYSQFASLDEIKKTGIHVILPGEYLEKIFQIPFQLSEAKNDDIKGMVDKFLEGQFEIKPVIQITRDTKFNIEPTVEDIQKSTEYNLKLQEEFTEIVETTSEDLSVSNEHKREDVETNESVKKQNLIKATDLKLKKEEKELLREMIWLVGKTPRTIKRFLNIYRIVRAHQSLIINAQQQKQEFLAIMFILAINIGEKKKFAQVLMDCILENKEKRLIDVFDCQELKKTYKKDYEEFAKIRTDIAAINLTAELLQIESQYFHEHIKLVGRFSFGSVEYNGESEDDKEQPQKSKENINA
jgi:hypothetical protein